VVDDNAAEEFALIFPRVAQADAQVAAEGPAGGLETHALAAGRTPELQAVVKALEPLDHHVCGPRLVVLAGILVKDPAVAPDHVVPACASVAAGADGHRRIVLDRLQPSRGKGCGE